MTGTDIVTNGQRKRQFLVAKPLVIFCTVCARLGILVFLPNFGRTSGASKFIDVFLDALTRNDDYWVAAKIKIKFRPPQFRLYLDRIQTTPHAKSV
jgi:hypothetical protein